MTGPPVTTTLAKPTEKLRKKEEEEKVKKERREEGEKMMPQQQQPRKFRNGVHGEWRRRRPQMRAVLCLFHREGLTGMKQV